MPHVSPILQRDHLVFQVRDEEVLDKTANFTWFLINGGLSVVLVLLGGFFAGLTLALMGQDEVTLRVLCRSGLGRQKTDAQKVLSLLQRGKHWVLVTLLLGNVIVNEALPVVLDGDTKGGWVTVVISTGLVVMFGEIIPQSVCAKWGLSIGASSSTLVIGLMYILSPIGYPIALLLDHLLGTYHEKTFTREGLKTLIMLHEVPRSLLNSRDRLHPEETSMICNVLSVSRIPISEIMIPLKSIFALSSDAILNDSTRSNLVRNGFNKVPVYKAGDKETFLGVLNVINLIGLDFSQKEVMVGDLELGELKDLGTAFQQEEVLIGDLELEDFRTVGPDLSLADALAIFRNRSAEMVVVSEDGRKGEKALGMVTFRDLMEATMNREIEIC